MGVFRPLVERAQSEVGFRTDNPSDKLVTPANLMTVSRPFLAGIAAMRLVKGEEGATKWAFAAGISDMEGMAARVVDKHWPESGRGATEWGVRGDPVADAMMLVEVGVGIMAGPKVSKLGKIATAIVIAQEARKATQAIDKDIEYRKYTDQPIMIAADSSGKEAMAEKMSAEGLAIVTSEIDNRALRFCAGLLSLGFALSGAVRGHAAHVENMQRADDMIAAARFNHLSQ